MDGNSRWATSRGLPSSAGHQAGYASLREVVTLSCKWGISALTVFAFSSENWLRPKMETDFLMMLFENALTENLGDVTREGIRICIVGDLSKIPKSLQKLAKEVEEGTRNNSRLELIVAISYSGRADIVQACQRIAQKVGQGLLDPAEITESLVAQELETNCITKFSYPDLLIRTSGEMRLSNFLLWQSAYTELYFTRTHWPDFREADYIEALSSFQSRQRRFGQRALKVWYNIIRAPRLEVCLASCSLLHMRLSFGFQIKAAVIIPKGKHIAAHGSDSINPQLIKSLLGDATYYERALYI